MSGGCLFPVSCVCRSVTSGCLAPRRMAWNAGAAPSEVVVVSLPFVCTVGLYSPDEDSFAVMPLRHEDVVNGLDVASGAGLLVTASNDHTAGALASCGVSPTAVRLTCLCMCVQLCGRLPRTPGTQFLRFEATPPA